MSSPKTSRKAKLTITISEDVAGDIDKFVKEKGFPRSRVMEEILREWIKEFKRKEIEKGIETYYQSVGKKEKLEDKEWASMSTCTFINKLKALSHSCFTSRRRGGLIKEIYG